MNDQSECPGKFKCHGPASWCPDCGDVDLVCDDPECEAHPRYEDRCEREWKAKERMDEALAEYKAASKEWAEATAVMRRYKTGNVVMVARGQRKEPCATAEATR